MSEGGPFSAIIPSMWPEEFSHKATENDEMGEQTEYCYDEFGFTVDHEDVAEHNGNHINESSINVIEDPQHKLRWQAHLEFNLNSDVGDLTWDKVGHTIPKSEKLQDLVRSGIPHSLRSEVWLRLSGALQKKVTSQVTYKEIIEASIEGSASTAKAIEKDLLRTIPNNACFSNFNSPGIPRLRRILKCIAWLYPDIGYCQGTGFIISHLLLLMEEENAFWMMCTIIEDLLPPSYFDTNLIGAHADQRVLRQIIALCLPVTDKILSDHDIELSLITLSWFVTALAGVLPLRLLLRVWDCFFMDGSIVLFKVVLGMLKIKESSLSRADDSADIFNDLSDITICLDDTEVLLSRADEVAASLTDVILDAHRKKHLAFILSENGMSEINTVATRKQAFKRRNYLGKFLFGSTVDEKFEYAKAKNIKQTELVSDLRNAILSIMKHFQNCKAQDVVFTPDYSIESHHSDRENYMNVSLQRRQRAKAVLNFEQHDDDELGFRKNDIITIISKKDEHCWIGELNGMRGWFPAKFVQLLDERSKVYSNVGDDTVNNTITDLVRGTFCPTVSAIFEHGLKHPVMLGSACHPWLFIEEAANFEIEKDFNSVFSRLVLCKTFRLDEDGKVLTPEELLYRCVQAVNHTHNAAHAQMDVKFRSLICLGLNEQVLHIWLEILCSCTQIVSKWYHPWSFIMSPGWVQLKCEIRILSQYTLYLSQDSELQKKTDSKESLKTGVRDMLVKHHLFSWDL